MDSDFDDGHLVDGTDDYQADDELEGWTVYRIFHAMDLGDFSVFVSPTDGAPVPHGHSVACARPLS